jgi:putative DNA primase/helicase
MLDLVARQHDVRLRDAIKIAQRNYLGEAIAPMPNRPGQSPSAADTGDAEIRTRSALRTWGETVPLAGTMGERYFVDRRGLDIRLLDIDHALRWHLGIGAVVALMTDAVSGRAIGIHRTFLDTNGAKRERKMLGRQGVVRLSHDGMVTMGLGLCEGLEDGLAVMLSGWTPIWVATSAGAIARFPVLAGIECLTIFADVDEVGQRAAETCAEHWLRQCRDARIAAPGEPA